MKKTVKKALSGVLCVILAVSLYLGSVVSDVQAMCVANNTSPETKGTYTAKNEDAELGTKENPFTILEIVPDRSLARIGYLIPGCEPINMSSLQKDDQTLGTYRSMFCTQNEGTPVANAEEIHELKFADQIPAGATVRKPWMDVDNIMSMAPVDTNWVEQETTYGMWIFRTSTYTESGYYQYIPEGTGMFDLEDSGQEGVQPRFIYNKQHTGGYNWVEAENVNGIAADYTADQVWTTRTENYYYEYRELKITNNDLLISDTFSKNTSEGFVSQVITLTPKDLENDENLAFIDSADLIVIIQDTEGDISRLWNAHHDDGQEDVDIYNVPTKFDPNRGTDVPWKAVKRIVERQASENPAALVLDKTTYDNNPGTELSKLGIMLLQYEPSLFIDCYFDSIDENGVYTDENGNKHSKWVCSEYPEQNTFDLSLATVKNIYIRPMVTENVYTYNGQNVFTHGYAEKKYYEDSDNSLAFDYFEELYGERPQMLSSKEFVQFILNGFSYKTTMRILEVEPTNSFIYPGDDYLDEDDSWIEYYRALLPWMKGDFKELAKEGKLEIVTMPSWEFIGKIEDLNAEYDMIVFGPKQNKANGSEGYNDTNMNGLIYSGIGDKVLKDASATRQYKEMQSGEALRYSGNDLTEKKLVEVENFLKSGKPVVVDSVFYEKNAQGISTNQVNKVTVDESSYVYQLFALTGTEEGKNIFVTDRLDKTEMKRLLSREKCEIEFYTGDGGEGYPTEYKYETKDEGSYTGVIKGETVTYVNSRTFAYQFRINGTKSQTYGVKLYIDRNGDGIYKGSLKENVLSVSEDEPEEITGLQVTDMYGNPVDANSLKAGVWYRVSKELPANYVGILPWKLEVFDTANSMIRDNVVKYSAIKTTAENREKIKVLQMNLVVNLGDDTTQKANEVIMATEGYENDANAKKFREYLGAVNDFDVTVEFLTNASWSSMFHITRNWNESEEEFQKRKEQKIEEWKAYLDNYDMLMIGYKDSAEFTSNEIFQAGFEYFVEQGKSLILSHDLMKDAAYAYDSDVRKLVTNYDDKLRELLSQRRYYSSTAKLKGIDVPLISELTLEDGQKRNGNLGLMDITSLTIQGEDGELIPNYGDNSNNLYLKYGPINNQYHYSSGNNNSGAHSDRDCYLTTLQWPELTKYININNNGQITNYPYTLDSVIEIADTHTQYGQLNLDDEDMVVWYSLTDEYSKNYADEINNGEYKNNSRLGRGFYSSRESDIRNSFYIYNVGNITYTGMGHTGTLTNDEVKLFVNTMISAYRAVSDNPYAEVTNAEMVENNKNDVYLYVPMDQANFDYDGNNLQVGVKITDPSWLQTEDKDTYLQFTTDESGSELAVQESLYFTDTSQEVGKVDISISTGTTDKYVYLQKNNDWEQVYCFVYSGTNESVKNAEWPGVEMEKVNDTGLYRYKVPSYIISPKVMFTNNRGSQYPGANQSGVSFQDDIMTFTADSNGNWTWTSEEEETKIETVTAYKVDINGNYYFNVRYQDLIDKGQLEYYLCLKSSYVKNGRTYSDKEVTKVTILPMPLFDLN